MCCDDITRNTLQYTRLNMSATSGLINPLEFAFLSWINIYFTFWLILQCSFCFLGLDYGSIVGDDQHLCYWLQRLILDVTLSTTLWPTCAPSSNSSCPLTTMTDITSLDSGFDAPDGVNHSAEAGVHIRVTMPEDPSFQVCRTCYKLWTLLSSSSLFLLLSI